MNPEDRVNLLSRQIELVAAHGVYAFSIIIFIFYQQ